MKIIMRNWYVGLLVGLLQGSIGSDAASPASRTVGLWDLTALSKTPSLEWGEESGGVQRVWYESEPFQGKPTRIFAYVARPDMGKGPFPGMVLVHGGGGRAFRDWALHWAKRGYVAVAMDLAGNGEDGKRLSEGGPDQSDKTKFREFDLSEARNMWTYHAVAAVIRAHSLLAAQPEVDRTRIGLTGISWGGYLTCIVAGVDARFKVAVPVYGCGYLEENSAWLGNFAALDKTTRRLWTELFDPSAYLGGVNCPILFLNGSNDFAYPLDSYQKSYALVNGPRRVSVRVRLPHGHIWTFPEVDTFVDGVLKEGAPLAFLSEMKMEEQVATAAVVAQVPIQRAEFHFTTDTGPWQKRVWNSQPAEIQDGKVSSALPSGRPLVFFLSVTDARDVTVTTPHLEIK